jgi:putative transposase
VTYFAFEQSCSKPCSSFCGSARQQRNSARRRHVRPQSGPPSSWSNAAHRWPPRFLIHDRDSRFGALFERRLRHLGIAQVRTPFRAPRANAISERWVKSVRTECLDHLFVFTEGHLRRAILSYVTYFNCWRPHRSLGQRAPLDSTAFGIRAWEAKCKVIAEPVLGGLHHVYRHAA